VTAAPRGSEFAGVTCTAPAARSDRMRDIVVAHVPADRPVRLLDIGCGTGSLLFRLADALPQAALVGIDVSPANVAAARRELGRRAPAGRVQFEVADYTGYSATPFDAIVADGVLHLVPGDTRALARKLAADLRPGGVLVCDMPYECAYNTAFAVVRRLLRRVRAADLQDGAVEPRRPHAPSCRSAAFSTGTRCPTRDCANASATCISRPRVWSARACCANSRRPVFAGSSTIR